MKSRWVILAASAWLAASAAAWGAFDAVKTSTGTVAGQVIKMSPLEVLVKQQGTAEKKVPVNTIQSIVYEGEPSSLNAARVAAGHGQYQDALDLLNDVQKIDPSKMDRDEMKQDVDFYKAYCTGRLALGGTGAISDAGKMLVQFTEKAPGSYHYLAACELVGDLLVADGKYSASEFYYGKLAQAPWPDYKMRAGVAIGRGQLAQKKYDEAEKTFDQVMAIQDEGPLADFQRQAAALGKARCLSDKGKTAEAQKLVTDVITKADPEHGELHARAYNTLGTVERKAGRSKEALLAFLHVDILYSAYPEAHAEALANLEQLWNELHKPERATKARQMLDTRYKNSSWAQGKGG
jgi:tetratricopeptide (TPR) repeat protein